MKSVLVRLKEFRKGAHGTEKEIIDYILNNAEKVASGTIYELAEKTFTSPSSVVRLCKKISFNGYKDFKNNLISEVAVQKSAEKMIRKKITKSDDIENIVDVITQMNMTGLEHTKNLIDLNTMESCIDLLTAAEGIHVFGIGSSSIVAKDAQQKFMRIDKRCLVFEDWHLQHLNAKNMTPKDVGIIISYSGETDEMIKCAEVMKENGCEVISITRYVDSSISRLSTHNLYVAADESILRSGAISSRISQLNIIDILYTGVANRNYEASIDRIYKTHFKKGKQ